RFLARLDHVAVDATSDDGWPDLVRALGDGDDPQRVRVHYLATSPDLFGPICEALGRYGLADARTRVVLEKPIGHDLASARQTN
ncbi:glucose-6-phosphate dehydrogenase, partial [Acinetobacter baumannii]